MGLLLHKYPYYLTKRKSIRKYLAENGLLQIVILVYVFDLIVTPLYTFFFPKEVCGHVASTIMSQMIPKEYFLSEVGVIVLYQTHVGLNAIGKV